MISLRIKKALVRINRISAWVLLVFMVIYLVTGYAWSNRIIMDTFQARQLHITLDHYLMVFFLLHVLISTKFTLLRHRVGHERLVDLALIMVGIISYSLVLWID
ncbi:MAG: hypothetical protein GKC10_07870 [Methanosarcinales archaeon]|nr:hypothetical protein [Methanosarcinales archaeon]